MSDLKQLPLVVLYFSQFQLGSYWAPVCLFCVVRQNEQSLQGASAAEVWRCFAVAMAAGLSRFTGVAAELLRSTLPLSAPLPSESTAATGAQVDQLPSPTTASHHSETGSCHTAHSQHSSLSVDLPHTSSMSPTQFTAGGVRRNMSMAEVDMRFLERRLAAPDATPSANNAKPMGSRRLEVDIDRFSPGDNLDRCFVSCCSFISSTLGYFSSGASCLWRTVGGLSNPLKTVALRDAEAALAAANTYDAWREAAERLDVMNGVEAWRGDPTSSAYDHKALASRLRKLRQVRAAVTSAPSAAARAKAIERMAHTLRAGLARNLAGMGSPALYEQSHCGTKSLIEDVSSTA
jgi:hypothetical protein